jgi:dTDP-4-dehydrorhamnose reductase
MRILVTGGSGLLGHEVVRVFRGAGEDVLPVDIGDCDVTDPAAVARRMDSFRPDLVVHCAAYTAVDRAESEEGEALRVNGEGTAVVARACRERGALFATYGSDYVFDGKAGRPYREDDPVSPLSAYGRSKLATERAAAESGCEYLLLRTQWLYGEHGRNFVFAILDRARRGEPIRVVDDQRGCPTWAFDLAVATRELVRAGGRGVFHVSNDGECTWHDFATLVLREAMPDAAPPARCRTADLALPAPRPACSILDTGKYRGVTGRTMRDWREAAREFLALLRKGGTI